MGGEAPRASWANRMASTPLIVSGVQSSSTGVIALASASMLGDGGPLAQGLAVAPQLFNGVTYDRARNTYSVLNLASAPRTGTSISPIVKSYNARGLVTVLEISAHPGGGETLQMQLVALSANGVTPIGAVITTPIVAGTTSVAIVQWGAGAVQDYSGAGVTYAKTQALLLEQYAVQVIHSAAGSWTYRVSTNLSV